MATGATPAPALRVSGAETVLENLTDTPKLLQSITPH